MGRSLSRWSPPAGGHTRGPVRLEGFERRSHWFAWARVGADEVAATAHAAGLEVLDSWTDEGRWFVALRMTL